MKPKTLIAASVIAIGMIVAAMPLLGVFPRQPDEGDGAKFSVETTPFGRLLDTPCSRALFEKKFGAGALVNNPGIAIARHLTMRRLADFPFAGLDDQKLRGMQMEFSRLDPADPACRRPADNNRQQPAL